MFRIQAEVIAPVLQCETTVVGYNPGPKPDIVAVDEGTGIAVVVHHTEVDRTTASQMLTWTHFWYCSVNQVLWILAMLNKLGSILYDLMCK